MSAVLKQATPAVADHRALRFLTAGSVDDGKSTLIGRLLFDSQAILADQLQNLEKRAAGAPVDLSLLTDGLQALPAPLVAPQAPLSTVVPSLAGPKRPQDRIELGKVASQFEALFSKPNAENGFNQQAAVFQTRHLVRSFDAPAPAAVPHAPPTALGAARQVEEMVANKPTLEALHGVPGAPSASVSATAPLAGRNDITVGHGDVLIAAITSCTNTSNPSVLLAAGLLAKKAVEAGLKVKPHIKTSLAPGSRIVTEYLTTPTPEVKQVLPQPLSSSQSSSPK